MSANCFSGSSPLDPTGGLPSPDPLDCSPQIKISVATILPVCANQSVCYIYKSAVTVRPWVRYRPVRLVWQLGLHGLWWSFRRPAQWWRNTTIRFISYYLSVSLQIHYSKFHIYFGCVCRHCINCGRRLSLPRFSLTSAIARFLTALVLGFGAGPFESPLISNKIVVQNTLLHIT